MSEAEVRDRSPDMSMSIPARTPWGDMSEAEVRALFAPLLVINVRPCGTGWEITVNSGCRAVGRFAMQRGLLDHMVGYGDNSKGTQTEFYFGTPRKGGV